MKNAIIIGHSGQDGTYLSSLLRENGYNVTGISRKSVSDNNFNLQPINIESAAEVDALIKKVKPDEIYYLAAVHQSSSDLTAEDGALFQKSIDINFKAPINFLECVRKYSSGIRVFYAASSHVFGNPEAPSQNESTPLNPDCIYGITKAAGIRAFGYYRQVHHIFASVGIFYNHYSPLTESKYVARKIVETAVAIKKGLRNELVLGSLDSQIDWGYAPDYMVAVHALMQLERSDNFVISSGESHTIREFTEGVFGYLQLSADQYVKVNQALITKKQKMNLFGDNTKLRTATGWSPKTYFSKLIVALVQAELEKEK